MFEERLKRAPLATLLKALPGPLFPPATDRAAWEGLPEEKRAELRRLAAEYEGVEYPALTACRFLAFGRTGDRAVWEGPYFLRRRKLCAALLGYCACPDAKRLDDVIDGLWLICEESSWIISAHNSRQGSGPDTGRAGEGQLPDVQNPYVDLFAAQTAMILSLACELLGDSEGDSPLDGVSPLIRRRVRLEVERRVLRPLERRDDFWWMGLTRRDLCNWTPWIVSNVMLAACVWVEDRLRLCELLERGMAMLDRYLQVLPEDGGCDEGPGYWAMAGGALLDCLALLERVTGGRLTFWEDAKLRNVLRFPLNAWLGGPWFVNYADCDARPQVPGERLCFAGERLGDAALIRLGRRFRGEMGEHLRDTPQLWRLLNDLFNRVADEAGEAAPPEDVWLPQLQMRVLRRGGFTLVCHGGVNDGGHSHNDCGSFMVLLDGAPRIVDAGNMRYTGATFSDARYTLWNTRGRNHNVPMIGGFEQVNGPARRAGDVRATADGLELDMVAAYPEAAGVSRCRREAVCSAEGCRITDSVETTTPQALTEALLLRDRPERRGRGVIAGGLHIAPSVDMDVEIEEIPVDDPRMAASFPGSLWRVAFTAPPATSRQVRLDIERI